MVVEADERRTGRGKGRQDRRGVRGQLVYRNAPERRSVSFVTIAVCFTFTISAAGCGGYRPLSLEKCTKTHLQQSIISKKFVDDPGPPLAGAQRKGREGMKGS